MRTSKVLAAVLTVVLLILPLFATNPTTYDAALVTPTRPADYVNTLIGTGTGGQTVGEINNFPGPTVPFGMVQYSPDTVGNYAGYNHDNTRSTGFSMTHASVGCPGFGDISMLPTTRLGTDPWNAAEDISHDATEIGAPGFYAVRFPATRIGTELTATTRVGVGRFSYPHNGLPAFLAVRAGASLGGTYAAHLQIGQDHLSISGSATTGGFCSKKNRYTVYFAMRFSQPFTGFGTWDGRTVTAESRSATTPSSGGYVEFPAGAVVEVRTALSYVSVDGAINNLNAEAQAPFDEIHAAAAARWNTALSRIQVTGSNRRDLTTFYSCLYRSLLHPNTFNDVDGRYIGFDRVVHAVAPGRVQFANFSDWDTYRSLAALQATLFPREAADMAQSLVNDADQSGALPRWALANSATAEMSGDSVVPLIVNLYLWGGRDFDTAKALRYMIKGATKEAAGGDGYVERPGIVDYQSRGYAQEPANGGYPGASITLEWSIDDFAISRFAAALGETATAAEFQRRSQYWQNIFDPSSGYLTPRGPGGIFAEDPGSAERQSRFGEDGFDEGNADQYLWWVPHNVAGLVAALGGRAAAVRRLDNFTREINVGPNQPYLWAGNEPGFAVPWLYNYLGQPWKTQQTVDRVRSELFGPTPDGEPGNDDLGALASWYVWAALGLYPVTPGVRILVVSTPLFDHARIDTPSGAALDISAPGASGPGRRRYIGALSIDGQPSDLTYLPTTVIDHGAAVAISLRGQPDTTWGTAESSAPPSFGADGTAATVSLARRFVDAAPGGTGTVVVDIQRMAPDAAEGFSVSPVSYEEGITAATVTGRFDQHGTAHPELTVAVRDSVLPGSYLLYLTVTAGSSVRTVVAVVVVADDE